jgi:hypothetical protein
MTDKSNQDGMTPQGVTPHGMTRRDLLGASATGALLTAAGGGAVGGAVIASGVTPAQAAEGTYALKPGEASGPRARRARCASWACPRCAS